MRLWQVALITGVIGFGAVARGGDDEDAQRALDSIESRLSDARSYLRDAGRDQSDRALERLSSAAEKIKEVISFADDVRRGAASDDKKRVAEKHSEAARAYLEASQGMARMKQLEVKLAGVGWPRRCEDLERQLKDVIDGFVDKRDHEAPQKIRERAEQQAGPVRDGLRDMRSQDSDFSSAYSQAERFSYSDGRWADVRSELYDARNYTRDGWRKLIENAETGCERVTKWQENRIVVDGLRALAERAKSSGEVREELRKRLQSIAQYVTDVARQSSDSNLEHARSDADAVQDGIDKLKDLGSTDPIVRAIVSTWPEQVSRLRDAVKTLMEMWGREHVIDRARGRCEAAEQEILALIKDLEDKAPIDQDREDFYGQCKAAADQAAGPIRDKLAAADKTRDDLNAMYKKLLEFRPEAAEWKPIAKAAQDSGLEIFEFYKGALVEAHRYCDPLTRAGDNPAVAKALRGDCSESTYNSLVAAKNSICSGPRACKGNQTCDDVVALKRKNVACYDARLALMDTRFRGGDHKHYKALVTDAADAIKNCDEEISKKCK